MSTGLYYKLGLVHITSDKTVTELENIEVVEEQIKKNIFQRGPEKKTPCARQPYRYGYKDRRKRCFRTKLFCRMPVCSLTCRVAAVLGVNKLFT